MNRDLPPLTTPPAAAAPDVYQQLGLITRQLHDALHQLGLTLKLQQSAQDLPDARSRLDFIARKTGEAAERVLNAVESAKAQQHAVRAAAQRLAQRCRAHPACLLPASEVLDFAAAVDAAGAHVDRQLTDIMLAQDFHDLTGQVVAKVGALVVDLESSLLQLLLQAADPAQPQPPGAASPGPAPADVLHSQREVDELLAGLGF